MEEELARLRAALEFYANPGNWWVSGVDGETQEPLQCPIDADNGEIARDTLGISPKDYGEEYRDW